jgi:hypothetical protein
MAHLKTDQVCFRCVIYLCTATHSITPLFHNSTLSYTAMMRILAADSFVEKHFFLSPSPYIQKIRGKIAVGGRIFLDKLTVCQLDKRRPGS